MHLGTSARVIARGSVILAIGLLFLLRGPVRAFFDSRDFASVYGAARCWAEGLNPYDLAVVAIEYNGAEGDPETKPNMYFTPSVYPPSTFLLVWPVARFSWPIARLLSIILNLAAVATGAFFLSRMLLPPARRWLVLILTLCFEPLMAALAKSQPTVIATMLIIIAELLRRSRHLILAGILLGLSLCVKPTMAILLFAFYAGIGYFKISLVAAGTVVVTMLVSIWPIGVAPLADLARNIRAASLPGAINDASLAAPYAYHLVNLQSLFSLFSPSPLIVDCLVYALIGTAFLVTLVWTRRSGHDLGIEIGIALTAMWTLMITYHRPFDVYLLWLAAPLWIGAGGRILRNGFFLACLPFFVPTHAVAQLVIRRVTPVVMRQSWPVQLVARNLSILMVAASSYYLYRLWKESRKQPQHDKELEMQTAMKASARP